MNNVAVLEKVLGYTRKENWNGVYWEKDGGVIDKPPDFSGSQYDLWVLRHIQGWIDAEDGLALNGRYQRFWDKLSETLRGRDPYYKATLDQKELYYILEYQPGDYAQAALYAVGHTE